jgi:hypothetical protein
MQQRYVKVEGTNFHRDTETMALVNIDPNGKNDYITKKRMYLTQKEELHSVRKDIDGVKEDVKQIKDLLMQILEKDRNG